MSNPPAPSSSRFTTQNKTTNERLSTHTVGLVNLSDFRKRRAEVIEQQEREARELHLSGATNTPDRSATATPTNLSDGSEAEKQARKKKPKTKALVSFGDDEEDGEEAPVIKPARGKSKLGGSGIGADSREGSVEGKLDTDKSREGSAEVGDKDKKTKAKFAANASVGVVPRAVTKAALRREAAEREALRKEFLALQAAVKATEIAIPFVFYDGTNTPGGTVRVRKGEFVWVFLDKSRKVGAELGVGGDKNSNARREWARVGVDDLMLVRGTIIIPHHYEFYFFIMNKTLGPGNRPLFDYSAEAPPPRDKDDETADEAPVNPLSSGPKGPAKDAVDISSLEGASDDPTFTKVVDRRWYERNKHIYPASVWQEFDPEKDYHSEIRRDPGGNAFFFSR